MRLAVSVFKVQITIAKIVIRIENSTDACEYHFVTTLKASYLPNLVLTNSYTNNMV